MSVKVPVPADALSPKPTKPPVTVKPPVKVFGEASTKVPCPANVKPTEPETTPSCVTVACGLATVMVRFAPPSDIAPSK